VSPALPSPGGIEPGQRFDRYELLCPIAEGGMASVWLARIEGKHGFEKLVAIKTILPKFAMDENFQNMLLDEARIASCIEHVNVAQILDVGEQHDMIYVVLEWVEGDSLSRLARAVKKKDLPFPPGILLRILSDACGGLHAAHELRGPDGRMLGVVHRDVSPQNILVSTAGMAKVIDFGIAKARDRLVGETSAGVLKGKVRYMAPEQALGRLTDRRADIWALGAVLYRMFSGKAPFEGENELASLNLLTAARPPPPLPPAIHPSIRAIVSRALSHDLDGRFATAGEMQAEMERAMVDAGLVTTTSSVAAFAAEHLAPYTRKRKEAVQVALAAAAERRRIRALMQPMVSRDVSTGVSRVGPALPVAPAVADGDDAVTVHLAPTPAPARLSPLEPTERVFRDSGPPTREVRTSIWIPVSGLSMRTIMVAACGVLAVLALVLLLALHEASNSTSAAARPPEVAPRARAAVIVPPPTAVPLSPPATAMWPTATPAAAPAPAVSIIAATDLPRAPPTEHGAGPRPPPAQPATAPVDVPKTAAAPRRVDDGF
jgi:tRNA A-37 threonylcarbamoyl transferase component Bud32